MIQQTGPVEGKSVEINSRSDRSQENINFVRAVIEEPNLT